MIRPAHLGDVPRLSEIHTRGWRYAYRGVMSDTFLFTERLVVNSAALFQAEIPKGAPIGVFIDDADRILKGFVWLGNSRDDDLSAANEILAIYVQPEFVRQGVGAALMTWAEARTIEQGRDRMLLWVVKRNPKSIAFYQKVGYQEDGAAKTEPGWEDVAEIRMVKNLKEA